MKLDFVSFLRFILVRYMVFIVLGGVAGSFLHAQVDDFFVCLCMIAFVAIFINVPVLYNEKVYNLMAAFIFGFWISLLFSKDIKCAKNMGILSALFGLSFSMALLFRFGRWLDYYTGKQPYISWDDRNYFPQRARDLERVIECLRRKETSSIGVEAVWGDGKSFLMEGVREKLEDEGYILITIDVMAIRLDNFPEYLIHELDATLFQHGRLSINSRALKHIIKASKLDVLSLLLGNAESWYAKLFDAFRAELLDLDRDIVLVYEDIDRIDDVKGIKNILYLSEKLTVENKEWVNSSIKVIYQYNAQHMRALGFDGAFLEKYIQNRIPLTRLSVSDLVRSIQIRDLPEEKHLKNDDIFKLPPYLYLGRRAFFTQEQEWMAQYFVDRFTIRRTKNFLQAHAFRLENLHIRLSKEQRSLIIAFTFIEYFLPNVYDSINRLPLYRCFDITNANGQRYIMPEIQREMREDLLDPEHYPFNFELHIAWRMLGLDDVSAFQGIDYSEVNE